MEIGVTGTRSGMNELQFSLVREYLTRAPAGSKLHHGDCVGVDDEVATLAASLGFATVCHPPTKTELRAYHSSDEFREPLSYFARNRQIVNECDVLMVVPYQNEWQNHGGTWYTHDYAKKIGKPLTVFFPNGTAL
jgi:hypothetical protein